MGKVLSGVAVFLVALVTGCASGFWDGALVEPSEGRASAEALLLGEWSRGALDCSAGECSRWYRLSLPVSGDLRIEIHAPSGPDVPDFDVRLEDEAGEMLWGFAPTGETPRKIQRMLGAGDYYLLLEGIGDNEGSLAYETLARLEASGPVFQPSPENARRAPGRLPRRPEIWMSAEIVRVEGSGGLPSVVVLDGGARDDWALGQHGELIDGREVIGTFELIEVDEIRSRGRLLAPPTDTITFETRGRVRVPLKRLE